MNRNEEYRMLLAELDALEAPDGAVERAVRREKRNRLIVRPLSTLAAVFALFVILVNCSTTVAYACSRVPGLRELAAAVTFSRSLSDAVDNEYVQPVELEQTKDGVTVRVEYLIVDQKSVTVFYRMESERYPRLEAIPDFLAADGSELEPCAWGSNDWDVPNGELRSMTADFFRTDVPPALRLRLRLRDVGSERSAASEAAADEWDTPEPEFAFVADFTFLLEFDPYFTAQGRHFETDQTFRIDGQTLHITNVDVYPSYLSMTVTGDAANTAWLESLKFYLVTDRGERFDTIANGVTAVRSQDMPDTTCFRADSTFFYRASSVTVYVTSAEFLDKSANTIHVDLKNQTADFMPEGSELVAAEREGNRWIVTVLQGMTRAQVFMSEYYDAQGNAYNYHTWTSGAVRFDGTQAPEGYSYDSFPLNDYPYDEVWLTPRYTDLWEAEVPLEVMIALDE